MNLEEISEKAKKIKQVRIHLKEIDQEFEDFLEEHLTQVQYARYIIFSQDFYRGLMKKLERARDMQEKLREQREKNKRFQDRN